MKQGRSPTPEDNTSRHLISNSVYRMQAQIKYPLYSIFSSVGNLPCFTTLIPNLFKSLIFPCTFYLFSQAYCFNLNVHPTYHLLKEKCTGLHFQLCSAHYSVTNKEHYEKDLGKPVIQ